MTVIALRRNEGQRQGKYFIALPGYRNRSILDFAVELGGILRNTPIYNFNNCVAVLYQHEDDAFFRAMTWPAFITYVDRYVSPYSLTKNGNPSGKSLNRQLAEMLLEIPEFVGSLLPVKRCNKIRLPIRTANGIELAPAGYHEEARIITLDKVKYPTNMSLMDAKATFEDAFGEFPYYGVQAKRYFANSISAMLGLYCANILPEGIVKPSFYIGANDCGAGKTTLAKLIAYPVHGNVSTKAQEQETELKKYLTGCVEEGRQVIIFDNMKGMIDSPTLQQFLTTVKYEGRLLGKNQIYKGDVLATVIITGNGCRMSADSYRRTLPIMLAVHDTIFHNRSFNRPLGNLDGTGLRPKLLAALWALVRNWENKGSKPATKYNYSFIEWSKMIGGILEAAEFGDTIRLDLKTIETDDDLADIELLVEAMKEDGAPIFEFFDILILCVMSGAYDSIINEQNFARFSNFTRNKLRGIFEKYVNRNIGGVYFLSHGRGKGRRYFLSNRLPHSISDLEEIRAMKEAEAGTEITRSMRERQGWARRALNHMETSPKK